MARMTTNPMLRKYVQGQMQKAAKVAGEQVAKHRPQVTEKVNAFKSGARGDATPPTGVSNRVAYESGNMARDLATEKPKNDFKAKAQQGINKTADAATNKVNDIKNQISKPFTTNSTANKPSTPVKPSSIAPKVNNSQPNNSQIATKAPNAAQVKKVVTGLPLKGTGMNAAMKPMNQFSPLKPNAAKPNAISINRGSSAPQPKGNTFGIPKHKINTKGE